MLPNLKDLSDRISDFFLPSGSNEKSLPILLAESQKDGDRFPPQMDASHYAWLKAIDFKAAPGNWAVLPDKGALSGIVVGADDRLGGGASPLFPGSLPSLVPPGDYQLGWEVKDAGLAALSWALGHYAFKRYKSNGNENGAGKRLRLPEGVDLDDVVNIAAATWLARDLINTPSNDLGPSELEEAVRGVASHFGADCDVIEGDDLLSENFPMIHAVGRASARAPRLIDMQWGAESDPKVTVIGKGICFDTGGLNIKPSSGMALMKKDMGGAATALALAAMIIGAKLPIRLRLLIAAAENAISGNAFRPGDVLKSRAGLHVEVGDTDAEGRLVLADALALADEQAPEHIFSFATLTGSARIALGPDLPPIYSTDEEISEKLTDIGERLGDPMWPMPFYRPYDQLLDSQIADVKSIFSEPFAGSVMAALFLKRFVKTAQTYTHFDIYGWVPRPQPGKPVGGDAQCARAVLDYLRRVYPRA